MKQYGTENEAVRSKMCQNLADQRGVCCRRLERYQSIFKRNRQTAAKTLLGRVISTSEEDISNRNVVVHTKAFTVH